MQTLADDGGVGASFAIEASVKEDIFMMQQPFRVFSIFYVNSTTNR